MTNPFREDLVSRSRPEPCTVVIFGATGDLTHRKLVPAIYNLAVDGELPPGVKILGFARREKSDAEFRQGLEELNRKVSRSGHDEAIWSKFVENIHYHQSEFSDADGYKRLAERLDATLYVETAEPVRVRRLVDRQRRTYGSTEAARDWVARVDGPNAALVESPAGDSVAPCTDILPLVSALTIASGASARRASSGGAVVAPG